MVSFGTEVLHIISNFIFLLCEFLLKYTQLQFSTILVLPILNFLVFVITRLLFKERARISAEKLTTLGYVFELLGVVFGLLLDQIKGTFLQVFNVRVFKLIRKFHNGLLSHLQLLNNNPFVFPLDAYHLFVLYVEIGGLCLHH